MGARLLQFLWGLPVHTQQQLLTYMRLADIKVGLLINFNVPVLRHGIRRLILPEL